MSTYKSKKRRALVAKGTSSSAQQQDMPLMLLPGEKGPSLPTVLVSSIHEEIKATKMNGKKRKRRDVWVEKELKKEESKRILERLKGQQLSKIEGTGAVAATEGTATGGTKASRAAAKKSKVHDSTMPSVAALLHSSKRFGRRKLTARERLSESLLHEKFGLVRQEEEGERTPLMVERVVKSVDEFQMEFGGMVDGEEEERASYMDEDESMENVDDAFDEEDGDTATASTKPKLSLLEAAFGEHAQPKDTVQVFESNGNSTQLKQHDPNATASARPPIVVGGALKSVIVKKSKKPQKKKAKSGTIQTNSSDNDSKSSSDDEPAAPAKAVKSIWGVDLAQGEHTHVTTASNNDLLPSRGSAPAPIVFTPITPLDRLPTLNVAIHRSEAHTLSRLGLPILKVEQEIMACIREHDVTILCGETGSGKTTQVPQFLYEGGYATHGMIGVTQPRRVAAVSMAERVSEEMGFGGLRHDDAAKGNGKVDAGVVGYQIRYDRDMVGAKTRIKFMTDGILLRELGGGVREDAEVKRSRKSAEGTKDLLLSKYACIVIDEAHERTVGTDILIGWLTRIVALRSSGKIPGVRPLKLIIMSATLRVEDFTLNTRLFPAGPPPVMKVEGRQFKVVVHYNRVTPKLEYIDEAVKKVKKIHKKLPPGGVLVFVTGQQEVENMCKRLREEATEESERQERVRPNKAGAKQESDDDKSESESDEEEEVQYLNGDQEDEEEEAYTPLEVSGELHVLPLYSNLPTAQQLRVFDTPPSGTRLVIVTTNVAETSLTIPGIKYVIDCGKVKQNHYDSQTGIQNFQVGWTSAASADQRAGRAGRVGKGHCYRLYSSAVFENYFEKFSKPEILCIPIPGVVLSMKSMGISQVLNFPFPTPPDQMHLKDAEKLLTTLQAIDTQGKITDVGKAMAQFPLNPRYGKMLVVAGKMAEGVLGLVVWMVAGLSAGEIFEREAALDAANQVEDTLEIEGEAAKRGKGKYYKTMQMFAGSNPTSDTLMMLKAIGAYMAQRTQDPSATALQKFCKTNFIRSKPMEEAVKLIDQLACICKSAFDLPRATSFHSFPPPSSTQQSLIRQVILSGFIDNVARLDETIVSGHGKNAIPVYQTVWSMSATEHFIIHSGSCLSRVRPAPKWIVFDTVQAKLQVFGPDGSLLNLRAGALDEGGQQQVERKFLKGLTVLDDSWLLALAPPSLINQGKVLEQPEPRFDGVRNAAFGFITPTFGPKFWSLPLSEKPLGTKESSACFARWMLEGMGEDADAGTQNLFSFMLPYLAAKPSIISKSWSLNQARVSKLLHALISHHVVDVQSLSNTWKTDKSFLLEAYLLWTPPEFKAALVKDWPPVYEDGSVNRKIVEGVRQVVRTSARYSDE